MNATRQIIALGGGGFTMEATPALDDYVLGSTGKSRPKICFLPTASGDADGYIERFFSAFSSKDCEAVHLSLFRRNGNDLSDVLLSQDVIYVGGGNTANMLAIWKVHGVDRILKQAYRDGIVLAGVSAGAVCWFDGGTTDSFGQELSALDNGLGLVSGSMCPHYDGEENRRPRFRQLIQDGVLPDGYAADDSVALHFRDEVLRRVVSSRRHAKAYAVKRGNDEATENLLPTDVLDEAGGA